jgi:hypothetical protein
MQLCQKCRVHPSEYQNQRGIVCANCASDLSQSFDWRWQRVADDFIGWSPFDPLGADQSAYDLGYHGGGGTGPAPGSPLIPGSTGTGTSTGPSLGQTFSNISDNLRTIAIVGLCAGAGLFLYSLYEGHKTAGKALDFATAHPDIAKGLLL